MNKCIIDYTSLPIVIAFVILTVVIYTCIIIYSKLFLKLISLILQYVIRTFHAWTLSIDNNCLYIHMYNYYVW